MMDITQGEDMIASVIMKSYQSEYERSGTSLEQLIKKYQLSFEEAHQLEEASRKWSAPITIPDIIVPSKPGAIEPEKAKMDKAAILADIDTFKKEAVDYALKTITDDEELLEIKEFKDLVAIVVSVENSMKEDKDTGPNVNIMVNYLTERFKDDC